MKQTEQLSNGGLDKIRQAFISKHNSEPEYQVILLMISDGEKWHYRTVKNISKRLRGITSSHNDDGYCMNCLRSRRTKSKFESHENVCKNHS